MNTNTNDTALSAQLAGESRQNLLTIMQMTPSELLKLYEVTHQEFYGSLPTKVFMDNMALTREEMIREIEYFKSVMRFNKENSQ